MTSHKVTKTCRDCGADKDLTEFWRSQASPDGRALYCKPCFTARNRRSAERRAAAQGRTVRRQKSRQVVVDAGERFCPSCEEILPLEVFVRNRSTRSGYGTYCRPCQNAKSAESIARLHGTTRHYHLTRRYGIGARDVLRMLEDQGWRCPICFTTLTEKTCHVDHDHVSGAVRGITCFNCNGGLGQFRDKPFVLRRAADYLEAAMAGRRSPDGVPIRERLSLRGTASAMDVAWLRALEREDFRAS